MPPIGASALEHASTSGSTRTANAHARRRRLTRITDRELDRRTRTAESGDRVASRDVLEFLLAFIGEIASGNGERQSAGQGLLQLGIESSASSLHDVRALQPGATSLETVANDPVG